MKRLSSIIGMVFLSLAIIGTEPAIAQGKSQQKTQRQLKRELYKNPDKMVNKEVRKLEKEGWKCPVSIVIPILFFAAYAI